MFILKPKRRKDIVLQEHLMKSILLKCLIFFKKYLKLSCKFSFSPLDHKFKFQNFKILFEP